MRISRISSCVNDNQELNSSLSNNVWRLLPNNNEGLGLLTVPTFVLLDPVIRHSLTVTRKCQSL